MAVVVRVSGSMERLVRWVTMIHRAFRVSFFHVFLMLSRLARVRDRMGDYLLLAHLFMFCTHDK